MNLLCRLPLLALFVGALCLGGCASYAPHPKGEKIFRNVHYATASGKRLFADVYLPDQSHRRPVPLVLWIHGGGWMFGEKGMMLFVRDLTRSGYAVASIDYRLTNVAIHPAQIEDCRAALSFLRENAGRFGVDPQRVYLAGASAGAHLAALLALEKPRPYVRGVFLMYPPTDLNGFGNQEARFGLLPWLLGGPVSEKHALAAEASPVRYVRRGAPPFLFIHGREDKLVPLRQSELLHGKLRAHGVESRLIVVPGKGHGFGLDDAQLRTVSQFFDSHR